MTRPTVTTTLKNLVTLYRKQGRTEAADQLDNCAVKIKKDVNFFTIHLEFDNHTFKKMIFY